MFRAIVGAAVAAAAIGFLSTASANVGIFPGRTRLSVSPISLAQCPPGYYTNSSGNCVEKPDQNPNNPTAICCDGSESHSQHRSGTCSAHGGVCRWNGMRPGYSENPDKRSPESVPLGV